MDAAQRTVTIDRPLVRKVTVVKITTAEGALVLGDVPLQQGFAGETALTFKELPPELRAGSGLDYSTPRERNEGNSNVGHEYGTELTPAEKDAIIEHLKTF